MPPTKQLPAALRNGRRVTMNKEISLYDNKLKMQIPEQFVQSKDMDKFFVGAKPDFLYVDEKTDALISVTYTENQSAEDIDKRIAEYCELYRRSVPNFANCKIAKKKTGSGQDIAAFYYTSTTPARDIYNFFVLTSLEGRELTVTLHCDIRNIPDYGMEFMNILNSIDVPA